MINLVSLVVLFFLFWIGSSVNMVQNILWIGYDLNLCDFKSPKPNTLLSYASFRVFCAHCYFLHFCVWKCWAWILVFITSEHVSKYFHMFCMCDDNNNCKCHHSSLFDHRVINYDKWQWTLICWWHLQWQLDEQSPR